MLPGGSLSRALLCLLLLFNLAAAGVLSPVRRQEEATPTLTTGPADTNEPDNEPANTEDGADEGNTSRTESSTNSSSVSVPTTASTTVSEGGSDESDEEIFTKLQAGQLPIQPEVTPGWGVAGAILLITGVGYALIGIKNQWVHTLLSTAYLGALSTTVLIIYLMTFPVSDGVQGAYVVAAVLTGAILGGGACIFKEITEGLGCMLGGFCVGMWLLTLTDGGLLKASASRAIFIAAFTAGGFATYFSQYTRAYGLIASISFAGATVVMLGVDCFSRAGLKEFWAYLWALNDHLFPVDTDTYPVTKGIRAETAIIIIIFLVGIVSQMQLWKVIKEHRDTRAATRAADQRDLQQEEETVGRQIEDQNARERRQWEAAYGNGEPVTSTSDSGVGSVNEKRSARGTSQGTSIDKQSNPEEAIEMSDLQAPGDKTVDVPVKKRTAAETVTEAHEDGTLTIRVATDDMPTGPEPETSQPRAWVVGPDGNPIPASEAPAQVSRPTDVAPAPLVVPLPFKVPQEEREGEGELDPTASMVNRSSVATFNDGDDDDHEQGIPAKRRSMAMRLSQGSATMLRKMSQRTAKSKHDSPPTPTAGEHRSSDEELIIPRQDPEEDRRSSLAATIDGMSSDGEVRSFRDGRPVSIEINAELAERVKETQGGGESDGGDDESKVAKPAPAISKQRHLSGTSLGPSDAIDEKASAIGKATKTDSSLGEGLAIKKSRSALSESSTPASLTKDRLPRALSRIALSYRTNEWAKHLSQAETPEPDYLRLQEYPVEAPVEVAKKEAAAPVDVDDLQLTADNGAPPPARVVSSASLAPNRPTSRAASRNSSLQPVPPTQTSGPPLTSNNAYQAPRMSSNSRRVSTDVVSQPIAEEGADPAHLHVTGSPAAAGGEDVSPSGRTSISTDRPAVQGVVSYSSPQTLIGQREMFLRNKSNLVGSTPAPPQGQYPERPSSEVGSLHNYPVYAAYANAPADFDDLPLSQRREIMMRQSSLQALAGGISRPSSVTPVTPADSVPFNSHQPQRDSGLPSRGVRDARLASFRQSVAADLRHGSPIVPAATKASNPFTNGSLLGGNLANNLGSQQQQQQQQQREGEATVRESINAQRSALLSEKQADFAKKEADRIGRERQDRAFEQRMRSGELLDAHRDAMRRLQNKSRAE